MPALSSAPILFRERYLIEESRYAPGGGIMDAVVVLHDLYSAANGQPGKTYMLSLGEFLELGAKEIASFDSQPVRIEDGRLLNVTPQAGVILDKITNPSEPAPNAASSSPETHTKTHTKTHVEASKEPPAAAATGAGNDILTLTARENGMDVTLRVRGAFLKTTLGAMAGQGADPDALAEAFRLADGQAPSQNPDLHHQGDALLRQAINELMKKRHAPPPAPEAPPVLTITRMAMGQAFSLLDNPARMAVILHTMSPSPGLGAGASGTVSDADDRAIRYEVMKLRFPAADIDTLMKQVGTAPPVVTDAHKALAATLVRTVEFQSRMAPGSSLHSIMGLTP